MNSMGDFSSSGSVPFQAYSPQMFPLPTSNMNNPYTLPMPALNFKPKSASTLSYHNGNGYSHSGTSTTVTTPVMSTKMAAYNNGSGYSNYSSLPSGHGHSAKQVQAQGQGYARISSKGSMQNIPQSMLANEFGIAGLIVGLKAVQGKELESVPDAVSKDVLTEMSCLKDGEPDIKRFTVGPMALSSEPESISTVVGQGFPIYPEYLVTQRMIDESREPKMAHLRKTWGLKIDKFGDDLLFYVFYTFTQDYLQVAAAHNLYQKGWRYHKEAKLWLQKLENGIYSEDPGNSLREKGIYKCFDFQHWKIAQVDLILDKSKLEGPPRAPFENFMPPNSPKV